MVLSLISMMIEAAWFWFPIFWIDLCQYSNTNHVIDLSERPNKGLNIQKVTTTPHKFVRIAKIGCNCLPLLSIHSNTIRF